MTPKEKAEELVRKFYFNTSLTEIEEVKECALILVDKIIFECEKYFEAISKDRAEYWQEVKQEIEKL